MSPGVHLTIAAKNNQFLNILREETTGKIHNVPGIVLKCNKKLATYLSALQPSGPHLYSYRIVLQSLNKS